MELSKEEEEPLLEHEFTVDLENIEFSLNRTVQCTIKYQYKIFAKKELTTVKKFSVDPNDSRKIPYYSDNQFIVKPHKKESEVKDHLKNNPLIIRVYDEDIEIGTVNVNLMKLYEEESFKGTQQSFTEKFEILKKEDMRTSQNGERIGMLECFFALVTKECTTCKSCNASFATSSIFKHLNRKKSCKDDHSVNDMLALKNISNDAQRRKRNEREKANYDPERRAKKHKAAYDPEKRALEHKKSYKPTKRESLHERLMKNRADQDKKDILELAASREDHVKDANKSLLKETKHYFDKDYSRITIEGLSEETLAKIKKLEVNIEELYQKFDIEINALNERAKEAALRKDIWRIYHDFNHGAEDTHGKNNNFGSHCQGWHKLQEEIHCTLKKIAELQGAGYDCKDEWDSCPNFCGHCRKFRGCIYRRQKELCLVKD
jgi:hypothetical protein